MPLREDLLNPIPGSNPSGEDLHYQPEYDKIKDARLEEGDDWIAGTSDRERKVADYPQVIKLTQEALALKTKDLQLAAWLTEALVKTSGFPGLRDGLLLCHGLVERFWDTLYPAPEDGDVELRTKPLHWIGTKLDMAVKNVPLNKAGHDWLKYSESRKVGSEDQAKTDSEKKARQKMLDEGKLPAEAFNKSFTETPKTFYAQGEKDLDGCLEGLGKLDHLCEEKFGDAAPSFGQLKRALEDVRHTVHVLLEEKRKIEPDPVVEVKPEVAPEAGEASAAAGSGALPTPTATILISVQSSSEPSDRKELIASVAKAAAFLRQRDPYSPAPYLMLRGLRWGELRAAVSLSDPTLLEAPPTELRQHLKRLALNKRWKELLEVAENAMALPCARAWLDLQRVVIEACVGLGSEYDGITKAIRSELKSLLHDIPQLLEATLMDDTPAANGETQTWLRELITEPVVPAAAAPGPFPLATEDGAAPGWRKRDIDSYTLATEALRAGQQDKAVEILNKEIARQQSGRGRFLRKMQLAQICISAGKEAIAQPLLEDLAAAIEAHKLEDWEDRQMVAGALAFILKSSTRVQGDAKEKQRLFERICRLDPVQALTSG